MNRLKQTLLMSLGVLCVILGAIGAVVPGMPTTVFLIAASWLFARSSPRWAERLARCGRLGAGLRRFQETGAMPRRAKLAALMSMWPGIALGSWLLAGGSALIPLGLVILGAVGTYVIVARVPVLEAGRVAA